MPVASEVAEFCSQQAVSHGIALIHELQLVLDLMAHILRCGCGLSGGQLLHLFELGASMGFVGPVSALQLVADDSVVTQVMGELNFKWMTLFSAVLDCRVAMSSPADHILFQYFSRSESISLAGEDFIDRAVAPLLRFSSQASPSEAVTTLSAHHERLRLYFAEYYLQLISILLRSISSKVALQDTSEVGLIEFADWANSTANRLKLNSTRSEVVALLAELCQSRIKSTNSVRSLYDMDRLKSTHSRTVGAAERRDDNVVFDSVLDMTTGLQCSVFQEALDLFILDMFQEVDSGGDLEIDIPLLSLVSQLYANNPALCRPFWEQWAVYRATSPEDLRLIDMDPFSPLCRLTSELWRTLEVPHYFLQVVAALVCDEESCRECVGFLAQPVVLRSWEDIRDLECCNDTDSLLGEYDKLSLTMFRRRGNVPENLTDIIGRPYGCAVGKIIAVGGSTEDVESPSSLRLIRWEDNCYSSWWGMCFKILSSVDDLDRTVRAEEKSRAKSSVKWLLSTIFRCESSLLILSHLESHWNDLCMLHALTHFGTGGGANDILLFLRNHGITPASIQDKSFSFSTACDALFQSSNFSIEQSKSLLETLSCQFQPLKTLLVKWCFTIPPPQHEGDYFCFSTSLNLLHSLLSGHIAHVFYRTVVSELMIYTGGAEKRLFTDFIAYECERAVSVEALTSRYHAVRAFKSLIPYLLAPDSFRFLGTLFTKLDRDGDGKVTINDFRSVMPDILSIDEFPSGVLNLIFFREAAALDYSGFFAACSDLKINFADAIWASATEADRSFRDYILNCLRQEEPSIPEHWAIAHLTSISQFCVRTLLLCDSHKKRSSDGVSIIDSTHEALSKLQISCLSMLLRISTSNNASSKTALTMREWFANSFVSDSIFQGALLRASLEIGIFAVLFRDLSRQGSFSRPKDEKLPKNSCFKTLKALTYGEELESATAQGASEISIRREDSLLPLDFSYLLPLRTCMAVFPKPNHRDILVMESLSELAIRLLCNLMNILCCGDVNHGLPAVLNAFNTSRAYHPLSSGGTCCYISSDGRVVFVPSEVRPKATNNCVNVSFSGIFCGLINYTPFLKDTSPLLDDSENEKLSQHRIPALSVILLTKLLFAEHVLRTAHVGISYTNRILDCVGSSNVAALTRCMCSVLEVPHSKSGNVRPAASAELIILKTELLRLFALLAKNDHMSLGHILLVTGEISSGASIPPRSGQTGAPTRSSQTRSLLSSAMISLLSQLESVSSFRKGVTLLELELLDTTMSYLLCGWDSFRSGASPVLAGHILAIAENATFWAVVTSPLMKDVEAVPEMADAPYATDVTSMWLRSDVSCYCLKLSILASSLSFLSMERFGQMYSIENVAYKRVNLSGNKDDSRDNQVGIFCQSKVDDFFRRCAESQRFLYWTRAYPIMSMHMRYEVRAQACALALGTNLSAFKQFSLSLDPLDYGAAYIYSLPSIWSSAAAHGWTAHHATEQSSSAWHDFVVAASNANCMWSIADSQSFLLRNLRHFLEVTVFPFDNDGPNLSRSLSISSRRSPSFELGNSPRADSVTGSPASAQSGSPKQRRGKMTTSSLSPKGNLHFSLPPSPSVLRGESSFIGGIVAHILHSISVFYIFVHFSDKRSYHLLVELLRQVAYGDDESAANAENNSHTESYFEGSRKGNIDIGRKQLKDDELGVLVTVEKVAIVTTMLHHQLKDICVRTADPSLAKTKFRDTSSSRLTGPKIVELLELLCLSYSRILDSLAAVVYADLNVVHPLIDYWTNVWSTISMDLLTCMLLLLLALQRGDDALNSELIEKMNRVKLFAFRLVSESLAKDIKYHPNFSVLLIDVHGSDVINVRRRTGSSGSEFVEPGNGTISSSIEVPSKSRSGDWIRPSNLVISRRGGSGNSESVLCQETTRAGFVKIALQVMYSTMPTLTRSANFGSLDLWHDQVQQMSGQLEFLCTLLKELSSISVPSVDQECDYSLWDDFSSCHRKYGAKELTESVSEATLQTRKLYRIGQNTKSYWVCLNSLLDLLLKFVELSILRPGDAYLWDILSTLNNSPIFKKFQSSIVAQQQSGKSMSLLLAYSSSTGEESPLCAAWARSIRFISAVAVSQGVVNRISGDSDPSENNRPLSIPQLLCIFVDTYKDLLILPFPIDDSHRVSIAQLQLIKTTTSLFSALDHNLPVWKYISKIPFLVRQRVLTAVSFVSSILSDGSRLAVTTENVKNNFVFFHDRDRAAAEGSRYCPMSICVPLSDNYFFRHDLTSDSRPSSPRDDEHVVRSQSFDSFPDPLITPRVKRNDHSSAVDKAHFVIGVLLEVLVPMLTFLRHMLPSPFVIDTDNRAENRSCFDGGSMILPPVLVIGSSIVYRTKREVVLLGDRESGDKDSLDKRASEKCAVVEEGLAMGTVIEIRNVSEISVDDTRNTYGSYSRQITVYTILLSDGTIEDGVPVEAIVSARVPLIPFQPRQESNSQHTRRNIHCTSVHLVQVYVEWIV